MVVYFSLNITIPSCSSMSIGNLEMRLEVDSYWYEMNMYSVPTIHRRFRSFGYQKY